MPPTRSLQRRSIVVLLVAAQLGATASAAVAQVAQAVTAPAGVPVSGAAGSGAAFMGPTALPLAPASGGLTLGASLSPALLVTVMAVAAPVTPAGAAVAAAPAIFRTGPRAEAPGLAVRVPKIAAREHVIPASRDVASKEDHSDPRARHSPGSAAASLLRFLAPEASRVARAFDGAAALPSSAELDPASVRVYLTRDGGDPVAANLGTLRERLEADPGFVAALNASGRVRVVINEERPGALSRPQLESLRRELAARGVTAALDVESIPIDWGRKSGEARSAEPQEKVSARTLRSVVTRPLREAVYLARTFRAALTGPTTSEILGGLLSKGPAFALAVIWWGLLFLPAQPIQFSGTPGLSALWSAFQSVWTQPWAHPVAFGAAVAFSAALQTFHGVWINTWQNLQDIIGRQRGINYQTFFNLVYVQATAAVARMITWTAIVGTIAPWQLQYWMDMGLMVVLGSFFGTLGYFGLNTLYNRGILRRGARSGVQQLRDLFFLLAGTFFASGSMGVFWTLFIGQQALDLGLYLLSRRARPRPILYAADSSIAATPEFQGMYPVRPGPQPSPLREALRAVVDNPLVRPLVAAAKALWRRVLKGRRA